MNYVSLWWFSLWYRFFATHSHAHNIYLHSWILRKLHAAPFYRSTLEILTDERRKEKIHPMNRCSFTFFFWLADWMANSCAFEKNLLYRIWMNIEITKRARERERSFKKESFDIFIEIERETTTTKKNEYTVINRAMNWNCYWKHKIDLDYEAFNLHLIYTEMKISCELLN